MILIQLTGLSGAGKSTLANNVRDELRKLAIPTEVIDGDEYRKTLCKDLGFSRADRCENIRRLGVVGLTLARNGVVAIMAAINPYEAARKELSDESPLVKTVWIDCALEILRQRDPKGLYKRAFLPDADPNKLSNLTGINDPFEAPTDADLVIETSEEQESESTGKLLEFVLSNIGRKGRGEGRALFIGRWNPFHNGHKWLIEQKLKQGIPVLIAVRDKLSDVSNPLTTGQTVEILTKMYENEDVEIITIPDIESVNFGREVGYEINEFVPPDTIKTISATEVRRRISAGSDSWKEHIDPRIQQLITKYLA